MNPLDELDLAADANLSRRADQVEYKRLKAELIAEGNVDAEDILRGFIWSCIEAETEEG